MTRCVAIGCTAAFLQKSPVDHPAKFRQWVIDIDDLVEPCPEKIILAAITPLLRMHRKLREILVQQQGITFFPQVQFASLSEPSSSKLAKQYFTNLDNNANSMRFEFFTDD